MTVTRYLLTMAGEEVGFSRHNEEGMFRDYNKEVDRLFKSAEPWGLQCIKFDNDYIFNGPYYPKHKEILDKVSFGFAFRAIEMYETLKLCNDGDIVLFTDSNHIVQSDPSIYYDIAGKHGAFFHNHLHVDYKNGDWTRTDCLIAMGFNSPRYWNSLQMQGNIFALRKDEKGMNYAKEFLDFSLNYDCMFGRNIYPNSPTFREHRHDQSILSLLREKYEYPYILRNDNIWLEYVLYEGPEIRNENPPDNLWRRELDRLENK